MKAVLFRALACLGLCAAVPTAASASAFSGLYVFGDSLSDVGNVFLATGGTVPAPPYFNGRLSNGPNWVDDLAAKLGVGPILPSLAGGTDFAFGSAVTGTAVPAPPSAVPNVVQQVGQFSAATGGTAPSTGLYAVWIGANDIFNALDDLIAGTLTVPQAEADLVTAAQTAAGALGTLASEGARTFLVPLIPDLGKTPDATDIPAIVPAATLLTQLYNSALVTAIQSETAGEGLNVSFLDTFSLINQAVANPAAFGLTDATDRCYIGSLTGGGTVCSTPDTYLFWDGQHPTASAHALIAEAALQAVPEPWIAPIFLVAVLGSIAAGRFSRRASAALSGDQAHALRA